MRQPENIVTPDAVPAVSYPVVVLLVDDQAMVGEAVRRAISSEPGVDFHYCSMPNEAVTIAERTRPTVILQDLLMPGIDGLTLVQRYRNHPATRDIPIVVLSTKEEAVMKRAAFAAGANDYLVKLPDRVELIARLRYHSRSYLSLLQRDEAFRALRQSQQQLLESNFELQRLTNSDGLTGLANRRHFDEYLDAEWRRARRERSQLALLMIDVDAFKAYNDTYGHVAGDQALRRLAAVLQDNCARSGDLPARFGGEEFAMILPSTSSEGARLIAEKVRRSVEALDIAHTGAAIGNCLTVSIGAAVLWPKEGQPSARLVEVADAGLYEAKRYGRNRVAMG